VNLLPYPRRQPPAPTAQSALVALQAQIYRETRGSARPIKHLTTWLLDRRNLEAAWDRVQDSDGAATPGSDGVTCDHVRSQAGAWLARLADDLFQRRYHPMQPRWIDVPKPNKPGQTRRLGILTVRDRVVHAALKQVLEPVLEAVFLPASFGFRPGRSVPGALAAAVDLLDASERNALPFSHAVQLDVADCFDTIEHGLLLRELARHVADPDLTALLEQILQAGGNRSGALWWQRTVGLVQGSSLSPLLCNLYLHPLDLALHDLAGATQNGVRALRYADDLLLLARDQRTAERALALTRQVLGRLQQRLRQPAGSPRPVLDGIDWLGLRLGPRNPRWTDRLTFGYAVPDGKVVDMLKRLTEMTAPPNERIDGSAFNLARWIVSINEQLRDWRQAYLFADNAPEVFRTLDDHTRERVGRLLRSVTGTPWPQLNGQYRVRLPRGFWTWEVPGARLSVLSALAPHAPGRLTRRPAWLEVKAAGPSAAPPQPPLALPAPPPTALPALPPPKQESREEKEVS
jgi:RNA-directed DNA polymerase